VHVLQALSKEFGAANVWAPVIDYGSTALSTTASHSPASLLIDLECVSVITEPSVRTAVGRSTWQPVQVSRLLAA
jgi:hypothetical protein